MKTHLPESLGAAFAFVGFRLTTPSSLLPPSLTGDGPSGRCPYQAAVRHVASVIWQPRILPGRTTAIGLPILKTIRSFWQDRMEHRRVRWPPYLIPPRGSTTFAGHRTTAVS